MGSTPPLPTAPAKKHTRKKARLAALSRHHGSDSDQARTAAAELKADVLEEHIRRVVDGAPPLTDEQRIKLALLLNPGTPGDGVTAEAGSTG